MRTSVEELLHMYGPAVFRYAYSFLKNTEGAEDIVQETFMRFMDGDMEYESEDHEKAWLLTVAGNLCRNELKREKRHPADHLDSMDDLSEKLAGNKDRDLSFVWEAVSGLPEKYRAVIHLYYMEQYTTDEIAGVLQTRPATVRTRLRRARKQLKQILREDYDFDE